MSWKKHLTVQKCSLHVKYMSALNWETWSDRLSHRATIMTVSKIVKHVVSHIIFTSYAWNVCLQHERKQVDAGTTSPTARSIWTAWFRLFTRFDMSSQFVDIWDISTFWMRTFRACSGHDIEIGLYLLDRTKISWPFFLRLLFSTAVY